IRSFEKVELLKDIFKDGELVYEREEVAEIKRRLESNLSILWEEYKRFLNQEAYPVELSTELWQIKQDLIEEASNKTLECLCMKPLQQELIDDFHVKPEIDPETENRKDIDLMITYVKHNPFNKSFVLGISGRQHSPLNGKMVQMAVDEL